MIRLKIGIVFEVCLLRSEGFENSQRCQLRPIRCEADMRTKLVKDKDRNVAKPLKFIKNLKTFITVRDVSLDL